MYSVIQLLGAYSELSYWRGEILWYSLQTNDLNFQPLLKSIFYTTGCTPYYNVSGGNYFHSS